MDELIANLRRDALERMNGLGDSAGPAYSEQAADLIERLRSDLNGLATWITDEIGAELPFVLKSSLSGPGDGMADDKAHETAKSERKK